MNKTSAIGQLRQHIDTLRDMGATGLYLFGSTVRDEASGASDLDLFIDHAPDGRFSLIDLVGIKQFIEDRIAVPVDITTRNSLHPMMRTDIERSAVRIFLTARRRTAPVFSDILEAFDGIGKATAGKTLEQFKSDWVLRLAIQGALEIISEAARHIPDDLLAVAPEVPWEQIRGIGNILRHDYHKVADDVVWAVVTDHISPLKAGVRSIADHLPAD